MLLDIVKAGTTDYSVVIRIVDATDGTPETGVAWNTAGIDLWYRRPQSAHTSITEATQTESGAHSDGGFVHISDGYYRLDLPDAAVASGVDYVDVGGTVTGMIVVGGRIRLEANTAGDVYTRLGAPAGASIAADIATVDTVVDSILDDTGTAGVIVATNNDKTGYRLSATGVDDVWDEAYSGHMTAGSTGAALGGSIALAGTIGTGGNESTTVELPSSGRVSDDDYYNNMILEVIGGTGVGQSEFISDYTAAGIATLNGTLATTLDGTSIVQVRKFGTLPGASAPTASQVADAVWDEARADHVSVGSFGAMLQAGHSGTAQAGGASSITLAAGASSTTNFYRYAVVEIISGTGAGQSRQITAYDGSSKAATVDPAWTTQPIGADSVYVIKGLGIDAATTGQIADAVWDEARAGHVAAGTFGEYVLADSVRVSGSTTAADGLEAAVAGTTPLPANVTQISGDSVAADNLEAYTDGTTPMPVNATQISGDSVAADNLEAALDGTGGVTFDAAIEVRSTGGSAGHNASDLVTSILTTAMTESYAADGAAPTLAQALLAIQQRLYDADVSGTTLTVRRLDGTTAAITITLDDGTNPTDINRTA